MIMPIDLSRLVPSLWIVAAILAAIVVFGIIRFFWQHIVKYLLQGCLVVVGIIILLAVLRYFKLF
jgi:hypothetical protein